MPVKTKWWTRSGNELFGADGLGNEVVGSRIKKVKLSEQRRLSLILWSLGHHAEASSNPDVASVSHVLEALSHALDPEFTAPRNRTDADVKAAAKALRNVNGWAKTYLRAHLGPERRLTKRDAYDLLVSKIDQLLSPTRESAGVSVRELEIAGGVCLQALGYRGEIDVATLQARLVKMKKQSMGEPLDRGAVAREILLAGGMTSVEIRKLKKARNGRAARGH